jgi:glycosyltransferase EpsD
VKKILFCATVDYHFKAFHIPVLKWFKEQGWEVHVAASGTINLPYVDEKFNIPIHRSPLHKQNIVAYRSLKSILDKNNYKIVHCHTPMGGVLTRLASRSERKKGTKVLYTAHGFHFCKGSPLLNWLIYYPIEKLLSSLTDCLITINNEDYDIANKRKFKARQIEHVHGVGVDTTVFKPVTIEEKKILREKLGFGKDDFLMFYAAEFNRNKNQQMLIRTLALVKDQLPNARLLLAGKGHLLEECKNLAQQLGVHSYISCLGYREDIQVILPACDISIASSLREGLPVNILEAMACSLPIIATENRGHAELVKNNINGYLIPLGDYYLMSKKIIEIANSNIRENLGSASRKEVQLYSLNNVSSELQNLYLTFMAEGQNEAESKYNRSYL